MLTVEQPEHHSLEPCYHRGAIAQHEITLGVVELGQALIFVAQILRKFVGLLTFVCAVKRLQHFHHRVHRGAVFVIVDAIHRASAFGLDDGRYREAGDGAVGDVLPEEVAGVLRAARRIEVEAKRSYSRHRC